MPSLLDIVRETTRRKLTGDDKFYRRMLYFFELWVPPDPRLPSTQFLFPLIINPESISVEERFSVEITETQGSGVIVEENGIILRKLRIRGHTGAKNRNLAFQPSALSAVPPEKRSHSRQLPPWVAPVIGALSGQRHFQYLQDAVFRTYGDLKRDPASAAQTRLFFHIPKDEEHWEIVPESFTMERSSDSPVLYKYNIEATIVGPAETPLEDFSEDRAITDMLKDGLRVANMCVQSIQGMIQDLSALVGELRSYIANIGTILQNAVNIVEAVNSLIEGVTDTIELPQKIIDDFIASIESAFDRDVETIQERLLALGILTEDPDTGTTKPLIPPDVIRSMAQAATGAALLQLQPQLFQTPLQKKLQEAKDRQALGRSVSAQDLDEAAASASPTTFQDVTDRGTGLMPGDKSRAAAAIDVDGEAPSYTSTREVVVEQGDTLLTLAKRYLGDSKRWSELAALNGLKAPFVSGQAAANIAGADDPALPDAVGVGQRILVPNFSRPPEGRPLLPVLGVPPERSSAERTLGRDLALKRVPGRTPRYDLELDPASGGTDVKTVFGMPNLVQAVELRLVIEKGTDQLYREVGLERIVGVNFTVADQEMIRFRVSKAAARDPRIIGVHQAVVEGVNSEDPLDAVVVDVKADVLGFEEPATIRAEV